MVLGGAVMVEAWWNSCYTYTGDERTQCACEGSDAKRPRAVAGGDGARTRWWRGACGSRAAWAHEPGGRHIAEGRRSRVKPACARTRMGARPSGRATRAQRMSTCGTSADTTHRHERGKGRGDAKRLEHGRSARERWWLGVHAGMATERGSARARMSTGAMHRCAEPSEACSAQSQSRLAALGRRL
jgi:hypothetical protein